MESIPLLTKFSKRQIDRIPLSSNRKLNQMTTQSVRNVSDWNQPPITYPSAQRIPNFNRNGQIQTERRVRGSGLYGRDWEARKNVKKDHMSKSVGILPDIRRGSNLRNGKTPDKFRTETYQRGNMANNPSYNRRNMNRSMTGLDHPQMQRKFSEINNNNWGNQTFDLGQNQIIPHSQQNNILSFKKELSNDHEMYRTPYNGLRKIQSTLSHMPHLSPNMPNFENPLQKSREFQSMQQLPFPPKRSSIDSHAQASQRDLLNMSHIAPSVYMNPEPRSFSEEDMEHRLTLLFRKMLVFSSKIDTLKEKIITNNPDFSSYRLFVKFSGEKKTKMDVVGLMDFFHAFNFEFGSVFVEKVMIFLSKYMLDGQSSFAEGTGDEEGYEGYADHYGNMDSRYYQFDKLL